MDKTFSANMMKFNSLMNQSKHILEGLSDFYYSDSEYLSFSIDSANFIEDVSIQNADYVTKRFTGNIGVDADTNDDYVNTYDRIVKYENNNTDTASDDYFYTYPLSTDKLGISDLSSVITSDSIIDYTSSNNKLTPNNSLSGVLWSDISSSIFIDLDISIDGTTKDFYITSGDISGDIKVGYNKTDHMIHPKESVYNTIGPDGITGMMYVAGKISKELHYTNGGVPYVTISAEDETSGFIVGDMVGVDQHGNFIQIEASDENVLYPTNHSDYANFGTIDIQESPSVSGTQHTIMFDIITHTFYVVLDSGIKLGVDKNNNYVSYVSEDNVVYPKHYTNNTPFTPTVTIDGNSYPYEYEPETGSPYIMGDIIDPDSDTIRIGANENNTPVHYLSLDNTLDNYKLKSRYVSIKIPSKYTTAEKDTVGNVDGFDDGDINIGDYLIYENIEGEIFNVVDVGVIDYNENMVYIVADVPRIITGGDFAFGVVLSENVLINKTYDYYNNDKSLVKIPTFNLFNKLLDVKDRVLEFKGSDTQDGVFISANSMIHTSLYSANGSYVDMAVYNKHERKVPVLEHVNVNNYTSHTDGNYYVYTKMVTTIRSNSSSTKYVLDTLSKKASAAPPNNYKLLGGYSVVNGVYVENSVWDINNRPDIEFEKFHEINVYSSLNSGSAPYFKSVNDIWYLEINNSSVDEIYDNIIKYRMKIADYSDLVQISDISKLGNKNYYFIRSEFVNQSKYNIYYSFLNGYPATYNYIDSKSTDLSPKLIFIVNNKSRYTMK